MSETIYALSSANGRAGVAVIRLSGTESVNAHKKLGGKDLQPRIVSRETFIDPITQDPLDDGLALYFKAPKSFTGEDVVELHTHGSTAVINGVLAALSKMPGLRLAEPGEFSKRAFDNGKLDLTEAEGLADLIEAETAEQRKAALSQLGGSLSQLYDSWRDRLIKSLAYIEADLEFPDEELERDLLTESKPSLSALQEEIISHLDDDNRGERLRQGVRVAIIGPPNAGKSSFINHMAQRDVAIVTDQAGTTRDVLEVHLDLGGYPVVLADTAGLRETEDKIEQEGVRRAIKWAENADLTIYMDDLTMFKGDFNQESADFYVLNKLDLGNKPESCPENVYLMSISAKTGIKELIEALKSRVAVLFSQGCVQGPALSRARHRDALEKVRHHLGQSLGAEMLELAAEDIRLAARELGRITGRVDVEDLLDVIFRDFCIGK